MPVLLIGKQGACPRPQPEIQSDKLFCLGDVLHTFPAGRFRAAKEKGLLRSEGKEYVVQDGDMIYFRFNV